MNKKSPPKTTRRRLYFYNRALNARLFKPIFQKAVYVIALAID